ncbi:MAG: hypothetical protein RLZZ262_1206 [Bacteroidota bacterium]|jgi:hypothetical protein
MKTNFQFILLAVIVLLAACKKDDNEVTTPTPEVHEEELITTLQVHLYRLDGTGDTAVFVFSDVDGPGGAAPQPIDTIFMQPATEYGCFLTLLNESVSPAENITEEIEEEDDEHLFCFSPENANLSIVRTDSDGTYEVGLQSEWTSGAASSGEVTIVLKHQPDIKNGSCDPGDTDIEVTFPVAIE